MENADVFLGLHDFLERMRKPSAADFVKSIKSFIVSFSNNAPDPEKDCTAVQEFFSKMEAAFRAHPLWSGCSEDELESAGEGLEKYVMTKLFTHVFASVPEDTKQDEQLSEKMALIQQFVRPENLDIKPTSQNETSWLLAQKELQKINMYKAPRDKLVCILNCCKVINNLLLNASIASNENPPGADEFLPVLIYVTIKANPPQLHSNLLCIQRYRRQSKLVGEAAYFFTNMLSAESFISSIDATALSMEEAEYEKNMEFAQALISGLDYQSNQTDESVASSPSEEPHVAKHQVLNSKREKDLVQSKSYDNLSGNREVSNMKNQLPPVKKAQSLSDMENKGAAMILNDNQASNVFSEYPYLFANVGELTIGDVEDLLNNYKQLVFKYVCLSKGLSGATSSSAPGSPAQVHTHFETAKEPEDHKAVDSSINSKRDTDRRDDDSGRVLEFEEENVDHKLSDAKDEDANLKALQVKDENVHSKVSQAENEDVDSRAPQVEGEDVDSKNQFAESETVNSKLLLSEEEGVDSKGPQVQDQDNPS